MTTYAVRVKKDDGTWQDIAYSGPPGPTGPGLVIVHHGTDGTVARPAGATWVLWLGTATPTHALDWDVWEAENI